MAEPAIHELWSFYTLIADSPGRTGRAWARFSGVFCTMAMEQALH
jgi:hypothetical protein